MEWEGCRDDDGSGAVNDARSVLASTTVIQPPFTSQLYFRPREATYDERQRQLRSAPPSGQTANGLAHGKLDLKFIAPANDKKTLERKRDAPHCQTNKSHSRSRYASATRPANPPPSVHNKDTTKTSIISQREYIGNSSCTCATAKQLIEKKPQMGHVIISIIASFPSILDRCQKDRH
ncbi:hypothetical protein CBL_10721 [Carabus blaptoides fortunei]